MIRRRVLALSIAATLAGCATGRDPSPADAAPIAQPRELSALPTPRDATPSEALEAPSSDTQSHSESESDAVPDVIAHVQRLGTVRTRRLAKGQRGDHPSAQGGGVWFGRDIILTAYGVAEPLGEGGHMRAQVPGADLSLRRVADASGTADVAVLSLDPYVDRFPDAPAPVPTLCAQSLAEDQGVWVGSFEGPLPAQWTRDSVVSAVALPHGAPVFTNAGCLAGLTQQAGTQSRIIDTAQLRDVIDRFRLPRRGE